MVGSELGDTEGEKEELGAIPNLPGTELLNTSEVLTGMDGSNRSKSDSGASVRVGAKLSEASEAMHRCKELRQLGGGLCRKEGRG